MLAILLALIFLLVEAVSALKDLSYPPMDDQDQTSPMAASDSLENTTHDYKPYSGVDFEVLNGNMPYFSLSEMVPGQFELYSELDGLGRCGEAYACLSRATMPENGEARGDISSVYPSGWVQKKYDYISGDGNELGYLYNRCHLIAWCLSAENDNELNLVTGTRHMNETMWEYEKLVQDYLYKNSENHVLYRVTPVYDGDDLLCYGVTMEAWSIEDTGALRFCVLVYNNQPGIEIDYQSGESCETIKTGIGEVVIFENAA